MAVASLYLRVLIGSDQRYAKAVCSPNGNLKPNQCLIDGKPQRFAGGVYHLRYSDGDKRRWESLRTTDPSLAIQRYRLKLNELEAGTSFPYPPLNPSPSRW